MQKAATPRNGVDQGWKCSALVRCLVMVFESQNPVMNFYILAVGVGGLVGGVVGGWDQFEDSDSTKAEHIHQKFIGAIS